MKKKAAFILALVLMFTADISLFSEVLDDAKIVETISDIFLKEYDNYKDKAFVEKVVLKMGRKAYIDNMSLWRANFSDISKIKFSLHPIMEQMARTMEKHSDEGKGTHFRTLFIDLTRVAFKHFNIYYLAIKEYLIENNLSYNDIKLSIFADALAKDKFYNEKVKLFDEELSIEKEIALMMKEKKVKYRMAFYAFVFDFFIDMRKKVIDTEAKDMQCKLQEKKASTKR
jgi:hypothetical protein